MNPILVGALATACLVAGLFFLRFWRVTHDRFFLLFALSFFLDAFHRVILYIAVGANEDAPAYYLVRVVTYGLILFAIVDKNRKPRR